MAHGAKVAIIFTQKITILPSVSIIIPVLNGAGTIRRAVASALQQTHPALEVIVVDNNSTDDTPQVLADLADHHPTLVLTHCLRPGAAAARNHGLRLARGAWIQFLDADDELSSTKLERQLNGLAPTTRWVIGGYRNRFPDGSVTDNLPHPDPWKGLVFQYRIGCTHANLFHRSALTEVGGWEETLPDNEDPELHFQLLRAAIPYEIVPEVLCTYHHHSEARLSKQDRSGGNARRLDLLERITTYLQDQHPTYWRENVAYFQGAMVRALRVYASYDLGGAAGAYDRIFKQGFAEPPALIAPLMLRAYAIFGFRGTEKLRLMLRGWFPAVLRRRLKTPRP